MDTALPRLLPYLACEGLFVATERDLRDGNFVYCTPCSDRLLRAIRRDPVNLAEWLIFHRGRLRELEDAEV